MDYTELNMELAFLLNHYILYIALWTMWVYEYSIDVPGKYRIIENIV